MASKRDWCLQQLGIIQWVVNSPSMLSKSKVTYNLSSKVKLLIVAQTLPETHNPLFCDVLRSLGLTQTQTYTLTLEQVAFLSQNTKCNSWRIGLKEPLSLIGAQLYSPSLSELSHDHRAKRALWQQIYDHAQYFQT